MDPGSIEGVTARLRSWCVRWDRGFARVEWDSVFARTEVVDRLKDLPGLPLIEIALPPGETAPRVVAGLLEKLRSAGDAVASITGLEWAFPESGSGLETLAALSFKREILAALPVRQIWWMPPTLAEKFVLSVPDLDSWFQLRLHLTEVSVRPEDARELKPAEGRTVSVAEARALARRCWERLPAARAQGFPEERIWTELARPAVDALRAAGLQVEADQVLAVTAGARSDLERQIQELSASRGPEHLEVLVLVARLASVLEEQGQYADAQPLVERVLEARTRTLGEDHPDTLTAMGDLALTLWSQGDYAGARRLEERVLEVRTRVQGEGHPQTLAAMNNLASTLWSQGDYAGARRIQERALDTWKRVLGEDHPDTLTAINNLASTLWSQGDYTGARRLVERVLEVRTRVQGADHPDILTALRNLALILFNTGETEQALRFLRQALASRRNVLGNNHPDTLATAKLLTEWEAKSQAGQQAR